MSLLHIVFALVVVAVWGVNFPVIQIGLRDWPPLFFNAARYFLVSFPWIFFIKRPSIPLKWIFFYGLFMFAIAFSCLFLGIYFGVSAGLASLLFQAQVFFTLFFAICFFKEKLHWVQGIGALVAFSGIGLVGFKLGGGLSLAGFFFILAGALSWGAGNAISKKIGKVNMLALVVWGSMAAWPLIFSASLLVDGPSAMLASLRQISLTSVGALAYITYGSTMLGFSLWSWLIHHHPLSSVAPFALLVPVFAMLAAVVWLGEPLQDWKILAFLLVVAGLGLHLFGQKLIALLRKLPQNLT